MKDMSLKPTVHVHKDGMHCSSSCPFLQKWDHPFYHHTAWCWRNLVDLKFHDYWIAKCIQAPVDIHMERVRHTGRTKPDIYNKGMQKNSSTDHKIEYDHECDHCGKKFSNFYPESYCCESCANTVFE